MSTYVNYAVAGALPDIATTSRIEVSNNPGSDIAAYGGGKRSTRRKADDMADGPDTEAEDEHARSVKRCKRSEGDEDEILQRLSKMTVNAPAKKRGRAQGDAVTRRKRFLKSTRNLPAQPDNNGGTDYAFTFLPKPFDRIPPAAIDENNMPISPAGSPVQQAYEVVDNEQKHEQALVLVSSSQVVDPGASRQASASVSTDNMETDEDQLKHDHAPDGPIKTSHDDDFDDIDRLLATIDHAPASPTADDEKNALNGSATTPKHVPAPVNMKSFIPRFLARAAAAAPKAPKPFIQAKPVVRGVAKSTKRARAVASVPYGRARRPDRYTSARRDEGNLMITEGLFDSLATTTSETLPALLQGALVHGHQAMGAEDDAQFTPILDSTDPMPSTKHEPTIADIIAATAAIAVAEEVEALESFGEGGEATSSTEDDIDDLFGDVKGASPAPAEDDFCSAFMIKVLDESPTPLASNRAIATPVRDDHSPAALAEISKMSPTKAEAIHEEDADFDEWLASLQETEQPEDDVELFGDATEVHQLCYTESPATAPAKSDEDVFGQVLLLPAQVSTSPVQGVEVQNPPITANIDYEELFGPEIDESIATQLHQGHDQELKDDEDMDECEEDKFFSLPPSPSPSSGQFLPTMPAKHDCDDQACAACHLIAQLDTESQVCSSLPPLCNDDDETEDSSAYVPDVDEFRVGAPVDKVAVESSLWVFRESFVLPDLEEEDVVVVIPTEEVFESGIVLSADPRFGPLVAQLDRWSMKDAPLSLFTSPGPESLDLMDADVWYDAIDDDEDLASPAMSPAVSQGDFRMLCDAPSSDNMDDILAAYACSSAPPSYARPTAGFFYGLRFDPSSPTPGALTGGSESSMLDSPLQPLRWTSPTAAPSGSYCSADTPELIDDDSMGMDIEADHSAASIQPSALVLTTPSGALHRDVLPTCGASAPFSAPCSSQLSEDGFAQPMLQDTPSMVDLIDLDLPRVAIPAPKPARALPGAWLESFDSADAFFLN
ncbi:hypothetical protein OH77DRAFT_1519334 [Trametes cingulata]|nr:hypothetical protein OH77DRAFT_1519334 [Trametes cingulata]